MQDVQAVFDRLSANTYALARTTAAQRAARITALMASLLSRKELAFEAGRAELGLSETDVIGQLIIIKAEADFALKHIAEWVKPKRVPNSIMMLGKKA